MRIRVAALIFIVLATAGNVGAQQLSLDAVLDRMDEVSRGFSDMASDIDRETVTVFINHSRFESGEMYFVRADEGSRIRVTLVDPARRDFLIDDGLARIYNPRTNVVQEVGLGEHEDKVEFMVLGFGTSRDELLEFYDVELGEEETLDGETVSVLDLTPRDPAIARHFSSIRLWMDQTRWLPVQTKATQPSGDYLIVRFSDVRTNTDLPDSAFDLDLPDDVQFVRP